MSNYVFVGDLQDTANAEFARRRGSKDKKKRRTPTRRTLVNAVANNTAIGALSGGTIGTALGMRAFKATTPAPLVGTAFGAGIGSMAGAAIGLGSYTSRRLLAKDKRKFDEGY